MLRAVSAISSRCEGVVRIAAFVALRPGTPPRYTYGVSAAVVLLLLLSLLTVLQLSLLCFDESLLLNRVIAYSGSHHVGCCALV